MRTLPVTPVHAGSTASDTVRPRWPLGVRDLLPTPDSSLQRQKQAHRTPAPQSAPRSPARYRRPKAAAACAEVHPAISASGRTERSRPSRTGSSRLRRYVYRGALSARQWDPVLLAFHERLVARGKPKKAAIVAVMHTLPRRLMGRLRASQGGPTAGRPVRPRRRAHRHSRCQPDSGHSVWTT